MAPPSKDQKFGTIPGAVRVRIQARGGSRSTQSFVVFGHSFDAVTDAVRDALVEAFGHQEDEEEQEEEQEEEVVRPKAKIRRRK